jgi:hypothetical protein
MEKKMTKKSTLYAAAECCAHQRVIERGHERGPEDSGDFFSIGSRTDAGWVKWARREMREAIILDAADGIANLNKRSGRRLQIACLVMYYLMEDHDDIDYTRLYDRARTRMFAGLDALARAA